MLPPFIIDQIRRREEELRKHYEEGLRIEVPLPSGKPEPAAPKPEDDDRGVVVIDL